MKQMYFYITPTRFPCCPLDASCSKNDHKRKLLEWCVYTVDLLWCILLSLCIAGTYVDIYVMRKYINQCCCYGAERAHFVHYTEAGIKMCVQYNPISSIHKFCGIMVTEASWCRHVHFGQFQALKVVLAAYLFVCVKFQFSHYMGKT